MVSPGITPTPPVMTRVGIPSVCESTALKYRVARTSTHLHRIRVQVLDGAPHVGLHASELVGGQRTARWPTGSARTADQLHSALDGLHELGAGIPPEGC